MTNVGKAKRLYISCGNLDRIRAVPRSTEGFAGWGASVETYPPVSGFLLTSAHLHDSVNFLNGNWGLQPHFSYGVKNVFR